MTVCVLWVATQAVNYLGQVCGQNLVSDEAHQTFVRVTHIHELWPSGQRRKMYEYFPAALHAAGVEFYSSSFITLAICWKEMQINIGAHIQIVGCWGTHVLAWSKINLREKITKQYFPTLLLKHLFHVNDQWTEQWTPKYKIKKNW